MDKLDKMINETLDDEDRQILEKIGREETLPEAVIGLFRGKLGWVNSGILVLHLAFAFSGAYAAWVFFHMTDVLDALRWGLPAAVLLLAALITRLALVPGLQTNRIMRTLKHLEMQVALIAAKR